MKVQIEYDEDSGNVHIGSDQDMSDDDLSDWLMAVAAGLAMEQSLEGRSSIYPPTMMQ